MEAAAIVLAAGAGTRMKSKKPKVAHEVLGKPLVRWVVDAAHAAGVTQVATVVGHAREQVIPLVEGDTQVVVQEVQNGTAGAVLACADAFAGFDGSLSVLTGDCPLIKPETIARLAQVRDENDAAVVVLTMKLDDPTGYGRIIRDADGQVERIVEQKDCTPEQDANLLECNAGCYAFDGALLCKYIGEVGCDNAQHEYYLPDMVQILRAHGHATTITHCPDYVEGLGVNSRIQLAELTALAQEKINRALMASGVTMLDPKTVWVGPDVEVGRDTELLPMTMLWGQTKVGEGCVVGPNTRLANTSVGNNVTIEETVCTDVTIDDDVTCGPRAYLRGGAHVLRGAHIGTHVELKNTVVGEGSKVPHLSYIGDCQMGARVNIGGGSITCNYDGVHKSRTTIGDDVFIGSDTMMVAPVTIGAGAITGASSCITKDVPADALAVERSEQFIKEGYASKRLERLRKEI